MKETAANQKSSKNIASQQSLGNKIKSKSYLILGIGTDVGKTYFLTKICQKLIQNKFTIKAIKPIASGFQDNDKNSDSARILAALNLEFSKENIAKISPWRFSEAASPHFAAQNQKQEINFDEVLRFCRAEIIEAEKNDNFLFIESAGGVMTPINFNKTFLDLAKDLKIPVLLVANNYLGAISHSLSALSALRNAKINIVAMVLNEFGDFQNSIAETIEKLGNVKLVKLPEFIDNLNEIIPE